MATGQLKGTVLRVEPIETIKEFKKRNLVLQIDGETLYSQVIVIEAANAKAEEAIFNEVRPGDTVTVDFNFRGREHTNATSGKTSVYNTLAFWKMTINQTVASAPQNSTTAPSGYVLPPNEEDDEDQLPF